MEYASVVWDPPKYAQTHDENQAGLAEQVEKVQRRGARFVRRSYRYDVNTDNLLEDLQWTPLEDRRKHDRLCMLYKLTRPKPLAAVPPYQVPVRVARHTRGHSDRLREGRPRLISHKFSFFPRTLPEWNALKAFDPAEAETLAEFKSGLAREFSC